MTGISASIPDITPLLNQSGSLQGNLSGLLNQLGGLDPRNSSSPLASINTVFNDLQSHANIDIGPLANGLPNALHAVQNALPENVLSSLENFDQAYQGIRNQLQGSPLAQAVASGSSLQDVGLAVIAEARSLFDQRLSSLTGGMVDSDSLTALQAYLTSLQQFGADFPAHQAEFLPFLTQHLLGVAPDVLAAPLAHVQSSLAVLAPLQANALAASLHPQMQAVMSAFSSLQSTALSMDPADAAGYVTLQAQLDALQSANNLVFNALDGFYQQLSGLIAAHAWDSIFSGYVSLLQAISFDEVFSVDDLINTLVSLLEEQLSHIQTAFSADDLRLRLEALNQSVHDAIFSSPLGQIRSTIQGFLDQIRQAIEGIPTEFIQETVDGLFARIQSELEGLGITQVRDQIAQAFQELETFINSNINDALSTNVQDALAPLVQQVQNLPIADLINQLTSTIAELQGVIDQLETAVNDQLADLNSLLDSLNGLSFTPVSDEVIAEIDELKSRLEQINPDALSDAEKLAISAGLAVLQAIDLEGTVINGMKTGYHAAEHEIKGLLDQLNAALEQISGKFTVFSPQQLLSPVNDLLDQASNLVASLNGEHLLGFLYDLVDQLKQAMQALDPGRILDPLQPLYAEITAAVNRLRPDQWVAPLEALYAEVDHLIDLIDVTPLLDELNNLETQLFASVRTTILNALEGLNLPEPLGSFYNQLKPVFELVTEAVFGDPNTQLSQLSLEIRNRVDLTSLFAPLDAAFMQLVGLLEKIPANDLTTVMETIRQTIGIGLQTLDPQAVLNGLRSGYSALLELAPTSLVSVSKNLPALKLAFNTHVSTAPAERQGDVQAVSAKFDLLINATSPGVSGGQIAQLVQDHANCLAALRGRINALDSSSAQESYARLKRGLDKLLPDFLRQPQSLTYDAILGGINAMRPSSKAQLVENALARFLQHVQPFADALEPAINTFFGTLRELMRLINPLDVRDAVAAIYTEVKNKLHVIDPASLRQHFEDLLAALTAPLQAVDPAQLKAQLNAVFNSAVSALTGKVSGILDDLVAAVDAMLGNIVAAFQNLITQVRAAIDDLLAGLQGVLDRLEALVFVEILTRLGQAIDNLGMSFDGELDRVRNAFDDMLAAIPQLGGVSLSAGISI